MFLGVRGDLPAGPERVVAVPSPVSPTGSGPAPRWGASRTDGRGNGDRFAAERHWRSLTPLFEGAVNAKR